MIYISNHVSDSSILAFDVHVNSEHVVHSVTPSSNLFIERLQTTIGNHFNMSENISSKHLFYMLKVKRLRETERDKEIERQNDIVRLLSSQMIYNPIHIA